MNARPLCRGLCLILCFVLAGSALLFAQGAPLTLGPLTVMPPAGWAVQTNSMPVRMFSPESTAQRYFSVEFFPPEQTDQDLPSHHAAIWGRMTALFRAAALPQSGMSGQFVWTGTEVQTAQGQKETLVLYSAKTGSVYVAVVVHASSSLVSRNLPAIEAMMKRATLSGAPPLPGSPAPASGTGPQTSAGDPSTLSHYVYATPAGWTANQYSDGIVLTSPVSATGERCLLSLWPMRPAGANLQADANNIFRDIFQTYELKNQTSSGSLLTPSIIRGTSGQGWDYLMVKRGIAKPGGQYETLLGFVFVARLKNQLAVISGLSKEPLVSTCMGELVYNAWPKFFYSLSFKNWTSTDQNAAMRQKIAGVWTAATGTAASQFTFATNGRYGGAAAAQQYTRINSTEVLRTTQAFAGDGAYTLRGNSITLRPDGRSPETGFIRLEQESKDEGRTWVDTLYILRTSIVDGKEYEVIYHKN
jgi:hypothetical protein